MGPSVRFALVGAGAWGREILAALGRTASAQVTCVCDNYEPFLKRAGATAKQATIVTDWRRVLESRDVDAIVVATPTPRHREIAIAALQAGKHVYCEAPLAGTIDDARAIAVAAREHAGAVFQSGLQGRSNALYTHVLEFVQSDVLGDVALVNAQWSRKDSWRRAAPTAEREREANWRLRSDSPGLMGEIGIHQLDLIAYYLGARPTSVVASGSISAWRDGRETPDTISALVDWPRARANVRLTLASSFGGAYTVIQGRDSSLLLKETRGWLIKEADAPLLGWEVYARKESVHDETGIAMVADATKLLEAGKEPGSEGPLEPEKPSLVLAFESFIRSIHLKNPAACTAAEGFAATVAALKAQEAARTGTRVDIRADDYTIEKP